VSPKKVHSHYADLFKDRRAASNVHPRARFPLTLREPSPHEKARMVEVAYAVGNFTVYRAVIDRLTTGSLLRMETQFGPFEFSAAAFYRSFPGIAGSESYLTGPPSQPNSCYYVVGPPPAEAARFRPKV
jgi:hypothetical protein